MVNSGSFTMLEALAAVAGSTDEFKEKKKQAKNVKNNEYKYMPVIEEFCE